MDATTPAIPVTSTRKCRHPRERRYSTAGGGWQCTCGHSVPGEKVRAGRNAKRRGGRIQRQRIVSLGGHNLPGNKPNHDGIGLAFSYESKSGPGAFSERAWRWLTGIPTLGDQTAVLIVTDTPGPGVRARSYVIVEYDEWRALHGEEA
jgi:hypothetical protein